MLFTDRTLSKARARKGSFSTLAQCSATRDSRFLEWISRFAASTMSLEMSMPVTLPLGTFSARESRELPPPKPMSSTASVSDGASKSPVATHDHEYAIYIKSHRDRVAITQDGLPNCARRR